MKTKSIGFIGGGRVTKIFLQAFKNQNLELPSIQVYDINNDTLKALKNDFPEIEVSDSPAGVVNQELIFIALHPPVISETMTQIKNTISSNSILISLAPKFTIEKLSELTGINRIVRIIPNATSYINKGYNPVYLSDTINGSDKAAIIELLAVLGQTFETIEHKLEAYAIVSAMLPTYFWFQWNEIENIAKGIGLTEKESKETIFETLKAALETMFNSNLNYSDVTNLIPVKPIAHHETEIKEIFNNNLIPLFNKIKP